MPLPTRNVDEPHDQFVKRCMGDPVMVRDFPDSAQRRAVCERQAKVHGEGVLNLVSEPGAITIEAAANGTPEGRDQPRRLGLRSELRAPGDDQAEVRSA